jgi:ketosteroid isomerase-like protein
MSQENVEIVRRGHEHFAETGEPVAVERLIDVGDRVVSLFRIRAVGAESGISVERGDGMVWVFREGKLVRLDYFNDQDEALEAVGLRE